MARLPFPHPMVLLTAGVVIAAVLTYVLPAGEYDRADDPVTHRRVVVANTYRTVEPRPVSPFSALVAIPKGMADAADVIFFVFLVGGALAVVDRTGALRAGVDRLARALDTREVLVVPACCVAFAAAGAAENMQEEIIALLPALLLLARRTGFDDLTAVAMSLGAAIVGSAFSPVNPFQAVIAQKLAGLPPTSGGSFRMVVLTVGVAFWTWGTMRYAAATRVPPAPGGVAAAPAEGAFGPRGAAILSLVLVTLAAFVFGFAVLGWDFPQAAALFFLMGVVAGLLGRLGVGGTAEAFVQGFRDMAYAALLIGFARAISVVLTEGRVVDTVVHGLFAPLAALPLQASAAMMVAAHTVIHVPVPSVSGQAVLTMPVLVPLSDLLGLSRQVTVLAYQTGAGLCEMLTPTNGALMAILAAAHVPFQRWLRFALPLYVALLALGLGAIAVAIAIHWQ